MATTLLVEKLNHRFQKVTHSKQASGLSVCVKMIADAVPGISRVTVDNIDQVQLAIQNFKPSKVVFEALWVSEEDLKTMRKRHPKIKFYVHIHSEIPFLACEGFAFQRIAEARKQGVGLIFNSRRAKSVFPESIWLPNIYSAKFIDVPRGTKTDELNVICGGSIRPMKNHAMQAVAAIMLAERLGLRLRFHVNMTRVEGGDEIISNLKSIFQIQKNPFLHNLVSIPWMEHHDFIKYCSTMDFGMQVSMSESFNIVAADYTAAGIPMVVSDEIECAETGAQALPSDINDILNCMENVYFAKEVSVSKNRELLKSFSDFGTREWNKFNEA